MSTRSVETALRAIKESGVKIGQFWRHYKGNLYQITDLVVDEATLEPVVNYQAVADMTVTWARKLEIFLGVADTGVPRFARDSVVLDHVV